MTGVKVLGPVEARELVTWIAGIDFAEWPQQSFTELKPAMVTDLAWHGFGVVSDPIINAVMAAHCPGLSHQQRMLSVVMPGHSIPPHRDLQPPHWRCRIHVPLASNDRSAFWAGGVAHNLEPGMAYAVDTRIEHAVTNDGGTPRTHFMWDVMDRAGNA
jgi:hypothetical protein